MRAAVQMGGSNREQPTISTPTFLVAVILSILVSVLDYACLLRTALPSFALTRILSKLFRCGTK